MKIIVRPSTQTMMMPGVRIILRSFADADFIVSNSGSPGADDSW